MNLTLALDERLVERARKQAEAQGKSLNQMIREYLEHLTPADDAAAEDDELRRLSKRGRGHSRGWRFNRDELHARS